MDYTLAQFRTKFSEFPSSVISDVDAQSFIDEAKTQLFEHRWKDLWTQGTNYWVAHFCALRRKQIVGDDLPILPVRGIRTGNLMLNYDAIKNGTVNENFFQGTSYGQQFLRLSGMVGMGAFVV